MIMYMYYVIELKLIFLSIIIEYIDNISLMINVFIFNIFIEFEYNVYGGSIVILVLVFFV